ncbi:ATP-binding cassette domain-containing protein, partial [Stenotrophomonas sp.]|uniref:ATP-binding cassette domain-containing protein n=1 Tax=Stenotrophomonas sp. TaxID=69392 RepID=UPI003C6AF41A
MVPRENVYMAEWATVFDCSARRHAAGAQSSLPSGGPRQSQKTARLRADRIGDMAKVQLQGVRKVYDNGQVAVKDASFEVADGELMVLVGPSGCGKSTLLRMVAGLEEISGGT